MSFYSSSKSCNFQKKEKKYVVVFCERNLYDPLIFEICLQNAQNHGDNWSRGRGKIFRLAGLYSVRLNVSSLVTDWRLFCVLCQKETSDYLRVSDGREKYGDISHLDVSHCEVRYHCRLQKRNVIHPCLICQPNITSFSLNN